MTAKKSEFQFVPLKDAHSQEIGKQLVLRKGERAGYVFKKDGNWAGYVHRRADVLGHGTSREKAFLDAEKRLKDEVPG